MKKWGQEDKRVKKTISLKIKITLTYIVIIKSVEILFPK